MGISTRKLVVDLFLLRVAIEDGIQQAMEQEIRRQISQQLSSSCTLRFVSNVAYAPLNEIPDLTIDDYDIEYIHE